MRRSISIVIFATAPFLVLATHCSGDDASAGQTTVDSEAGMPDSVVAPPAESGSADTTGTEEPANLPETGGCIPVKAFQVSEEPGASRNVHVASNGNGYGLAWSDDRDSTQQVYFARLDANGAKIGNDVRVTDVMFDAGVADGGPARFLGVSGLVWTGTEYGLFWLADGLWFERVDASGKPSTPVLIGVTEPNPNGRRVAWNGTHFGLAWFDNHEGDFEVYFERVDSTGKKVGNDVRVTNVPGNSFTPSLAAAGANYGIAWHDNRGDAGYHVFFSQVDSMGVETVDDTQVTTSNGGGAQLAWTGDGYGIAWGNATVLFARLDALGKKIGQEAMLTTGASAAAMVWTGQGFALAQVAAGANGIVPLSLARTDPSGVKLGPDVVLSNTASEQGSVSVVGVAGSVAVGWIEKKGGSTEVDFAVTCP